MHVLIAAVSSAVAPSGICRHAANLATSLAPTTGISRVTLLVGKWQEPYFKTAFQMTNTKVDIVPVNIGRSPAARNLWYLTKLPDLAATLQVNVVHLSFPAPILRRHFDCPVVSSIHDTYPYDIPANFGRNHGVLNRIFLRQCIRESDFLVCVSDFTLSRLRSVFGTAVEGKAARIYPFVSIDSSHMKAPASTELSCQPFVLTVAQHRKNKNLSLLLPAFADLKRRHGYGDLKLVVVGSAGPETAHLHSLSRQLCLEKNVVFASALKDAELCWFYKHCVLFVAASSIEGFGHPVCEALQCGSRVLCSSIPAFREVGGPECHYFDLASVSYPAVLADAMARAMIHTPPGLCSWKRFSAEETAARHLTLYNSLGSCPPTGLS
jgi:glycosyltransferase involved in cell wall biosynthesis